MNKLIQGKKIIVGVTGSIAAYKSALLVRELIKAGAEVRVVMSPSAVDFITPLTLATLSKNPVHSDFTEDKDSGVWVNHVEMGIWADAIVIAPCTANTIGKMCSGVCDNFLLAVYLSARCPVFVAPAMDLDMFTHVSTQENLDTIKNRGQFIIDPNSGELASGLEGKGRMAEPEEILTFLSSYFLNKSPLKGKKIVITAGPTYENIDPVRFIGNYSSGKMGYELAKAFAELGAEVNLISGPSNLNIEHPLINLIRITSAQEMFNQTKKHFGDCDAMIAAAAVADYRPKNQATEKLKKTATEMHLDLEKTKDILLAMGKLKNEQILVGFALETENELENAKKKLVKKNLDMIVLNSLRDEGAGFGGDTNKITLIKANNKITNFELKSKADVASDIATEVKALLI